jgi:malonate-semialdehyde dehydrogenase (acetylating)/methylmalonate-semialdehyde dehydrogenase
MHKDVTATVGHLIDGQIVPDTERTQPVFNPATGQSTSVALASKATVEAAIASAERPSRPGATRRRSSARA